MCGILGQVHSKQRLSAQVLESIEHRGPDASGLWHTEVAKHQISLGHTRLSILDLTRLGHNRCTAKVIDGIVFQW